MDSFVVDKKEIDLSFSKETDENPEYYLSKLIKKLKANTGWLTIGPKFTIGSNKNKNNKI